MGSRCHGSGGRAMVNCLGRQQIMATAARWIFKMSGDPTPDRAKREILLDYSATGPDLGFP